MSTRSQEAFHTSILNQRPAEWRKIIWLSVLVTLGFLAFEATAQSPGTKLWEITLTGQVRTSPALGGDGTIYVAASTVSGPGYVYAISAEGTNLWTRVIGVPLIPSSPCVGSDGTIYLGTETGQLLAKNPQGDEKWIFRTGETWPVSSPALGVDGTIYIRAYGRFFDRLYSVSPEGGTNWSVVLSMSSGETLPQMSSPTIGADGTIYVTSGRSMLFAFSPAGGTNWIYSLGSKTYASPSVAPDGTVYIGADDKYVYAISHDGHLKWRYLAPGFVESSAANAADGSVYVGYYKVGQGGLLALSPSGEKLWSLDQGAGVSASPAIDEAGNVYVSELTSGWFRALNSTGSNIWSFPITALDAFASPVISTNGTIYVGHGNKLLALVGGSPLARCGWPMFRGDPQHTARVPQRDVRCTAPQPNGDFDILLRTEIGRSYQLQVSMNLQEWSNLLDFTVTNWNPSFKRTTQSHPQEFFRLQGPID
ncbi:MAG: PQQ-like beta-propeller repeat protein [Verrucomicrobiae bacterium]|nr:PQQ-like beta-propeller repeat protein [Verrucomicrobiae bacterium]